MMPRKTVETIYPLTPSQRGMLYESLLSSRAGLHIEQSIWKLDGTLDIQAFERAWDVTVRRHAILRTAFVYRGQREPVQVVLKHAGVPLETTDLRSVEPHRRQERLNDYIAADRRGGFDLAKAPLMRLHVFRLNDDAYRIVWTYHHILLDGWSLPIVVRDVMAAYEAFARGAEPALPPSRSYGDYFAWLKRQNLEAAEAFWRRTLSGFTRPTPLGVMAGPRDATGGGEEGAAARHDDVTSAERFGQYTASLSASTTSALRSVLQEHAITVSTLVQGMWALLLSRYCGEEDVAFGVTVSGRPPELGDVESLTGMFINTLPLRVAVPPGDMLLRWLKTIQETHQEQLDYQYCSAGQIHQWSEVRGALPLYDSILVFENYPIAAVGAAGVSVETGVATRAHDAGGTSDGGGAMREETRVFAPDNVANAPARASGGAITMNGSERTGESGSEFGAAAESGDAKTKPDGAGSESIGARTRHPLTILAAPGGVLSFKFVYDTRRFDDDDVARIARHFVALCERARADHGSRLSAFMAAIPEDEVPAFRSLHRPGEDAPGRRFTPPRTPTEQHLAGMWKDLLGIDRVSVNDNFFDLGGYSILAASLHDRIVREFGRDVPLEVLFQRPTIGDLAAVLLEWTDEIPTSPLVPMQPLGSKRPLFFIHPLSGAVWPYYTLASLMDKDQPFYAIQDPGLYTDRDPHGTLEEMAAEYIETIRTVQPEGPYRIGGWSGGGLIAYEIAQQLVRAGEEVSRLVLVCVSIRTPNKPTNRPLRDRIQIRKYKLQVAFAAFTKAIPYIRDGIYLVTSMGRDMRARREKKQSVFGYFWKLWIGFIWHYWLKSADMARIASRNDRILLFRQPRFRRLVYMIGAHTKPFSRYIPEPYPGRVVLFRTAEQGEAPTLGWRFIARKGVEVHKIPGTHIGCLQRPYVEVLAEELRAVLAGDD
jgi:thioesterase domain-containing protein